MEAIIILLLIGAIFCVFVLPILASIKAGNAARQARELASRVADLESRLASLAGQLRASQGRTLLPAVQERDRTVVAPASGVDVGAPPPPPPSLFPAVPPPVVAPAMPGDPAGDTDDFLDRMERARARIRGGQVRQDAEEEPAVPPPPPVGIPPPVPPARPASVETEKPAISLEQFMGVKMFAWLGGVAMFFGVIFFVKYAFERNLIPPAVRVALGFVTGAGLLAGGLATHRKEAYRVLAQAFCATGVLILYGVSYAAHAVYHFPAFGPWLTFGLMAVITAAAILIAVRLDAAVVAVLGMIGGFLAPILLPSVQDNTFALFSYIALLDIGLLAVTGKGRWPTLAAGAAIGTAITQMAWFAQFFTQGQYHEGARTYVPMGLALFFIALFLVAAWMMRKSEDNRADAAMGAGIGLAGLAVVFAFVCLAYPAITDRPFLLYGFVLALNAVVVAAMLTRPAFSWLYPMAPGITFLHLGLWTAWRLKPDLFGSALAVFLVFGVVHACLPLLWRRAAGWRGARRSQIPPALTPPRRPSCRLALVPCHSPC